MLALDQIERELSVLAGDGYCADPVSLARGAIQLLTPPEDIATTDCAALYRYIKNPEGSGKRLWSLSRTPYMAGPQAAMDSPRYRMTVVVGPERSGKSVGGENYLFKCLRNGPLTDAIIYLQAGVDCDSYADKEFQWFVELHPIIRNKLGPSASDRKKRHKKFSGRSVQILPANDGNLRQKEAQLIIATEIDGYKRTAAKVVNEIRGRQKSFGNKAKAYIESHPDLGWEVGIARAWRDGTRCIPYWACASCGGYSTPHQLAPKGMRSTLFYERDDGLDDYGRAAKAERTAALLCPHYGCLINDDARYGMIDHIVWVADGQSIAIDGTITGEERPNEIASFWIHGLIVKRPVAALAREHLSATVHFERTRRPDNIKRFTVKSLGEVYEGAKGTAAALAPDKLAERALGDGSFAVGTVPDGVMFITAAVDVGGSKFDIGFWGWDLEGRSWLLDRITLKQRRWRDGVMRDLRPAERIEDWLILRGEVLDRVLPFAGDASQGLTVAAVTIDSGDGNVTWKAREFARRMALAGLCWGSGKHRWERVRLIKGAKSPLAAELPNKGREISLDDEGRPVAPVVLEWDLGVHKLKTLSVERLAVDDGGPGQCFFAAGLPKSTFAEFTGEVLIDGAWERRGPNESLDLFGYAEAARLMLKPDRADINWDIGPIWARPLPIGTGHDDTNTESRPAPPRAPTARERMAALNRRK